ncbi:hypothetical protein FP2506_03444 [Fulvimarina pelagi HTCC2506]|uniref:Uncharacterized protein n=2 Tax=Fulvimarina pelagi TaxID=217511 RepID=Q0G044_9HYPH|nr:hypothetical protein [Fulvimarina pelagi]EAU40749.1 hypothetical protein FP2506_03444 [Fulvimarina pelagi HTCC2506]BAT31290.1 hypothetical protein [Fulvimarina pelagi]
MVDRPVGSSLTIAALALTWCVLGVLVSGPAAAGEPVVENVEVTRTGEGVYSFAVTLSHGDEGTDHYADRWEVKAADGTVYGTRELLHPHVNEQPFTRSEFGIEIPTDVTTVFVSGHDNVHGDGEAVEVALPTQ